MSKPLILFRLIFCYAGHRATVKVDRKMLTELMPRIRNNPSWPGNFVAILERVHAHPDDQMARLEARAVTGCKIQADKEWFEAVARHADEVRYKFSFKIKDKE